MLGVAAAIRGRGLGNDVTLITDDRFSGATYGFIVAMCRPRRRSEVRSESFATVISGLSSPSFFVPLSSTKTKQRGIAGKKSPDPSDRAKARKVRSTRPGREPAGSTPIASLPPV